jgi:hypothetical protein
MKKEYTSNRRSGLVALMILLDGMLVMIAILVVVSDDVIGYLGYFYDYHGRSIS